MGKTYALMAVADMNTLSMWKDARLSCVMITAGEVTPANAKAKPKMQPASTLFPRKGILDHSIDIGLN